MQVRQRLVCIFKLRLTNERAGKVYLVVLILFFNCVSTETKEIFKNATPKAYNPTVLFTVQFIIPFLQIVSKLFIVRKVAPPKNIYIFFLCYKIFLTVRLVECRGIEPIVRELYPIVSISPFDVENQIVFSCQITSTIQH